MPEMPDAIILCGGAGLRLRDVTGSGPKSMADIAGRPFLEVLLRQLRRTGFNRVILAVGYRQDIIRTFFKDRDLGLEIVYSEERSPLGTGGALRNAVDLIRSDATLVMNGDSYTNADLAAFVEYHRNSGADASFIVSPPDGRGDCGNVRLDEANRVVEFKEKEGPSNAAYLSAGIYVISPRLLSDIPQGVPVSLENELVRRWLAHGKRIIGFVHSGGCIDIGTPERYLFAQRVLAHAETEAVPVRESSL